MLEAALQDRDRVTLDIDASVIHAKKKIARRTYKGRRAARRCRWMTVPSPKPGPLPAPCMPWPGPRRPSAWRCRERPWTGPARKTRTGRGFRASAGCLCLTVIACSLPVLMRLSLPPEWRARRAGTFRYRLHAMVRQAVRHARQRVLKAIPASLGLLEEMLWRMPTCRKQPRIRSPGIRHRARKHDPPPRSGMETGAAMPRIRPYGQVRNTPAPRPTEYRPVADKKISIYGLGIEVITMWEVQLFCRSPQGSM